MWVGGFGGFGEVFLAPWDPVFWANFLLGWPSPARRYNTQE